MWYEIDLRNRLELATQYVAGMLDADKEGEPFFHITRRDDGTCFAGHAHEIGIPHVTGRALDTLFITEETLGRPAPEPATTVYADYLFGCLDNEDSLPSFYNPPPAEFKRGVEFHNVREALEGLYWLIKLRDSDEARKYARGMLATLDKLSLPGGRYAWERIAELGRQGIWVGIGEVQTVSSGRVVGPLMKYYRLTGESLALRLAGGYAKYVMDVSFDEHGLLTDLAGNHIHSITSSLSGILDYALTVGDEAMVEVVRRAAEVGLREYWTTYGWVKEQAWLETDQGEVNQIGDMVQLWLSLAAHRDPRYYERAETWLRGALLPSQVLDSSFCVENESPAGDHEHNLLARMIGGFGFPTPNAHLQKPSSPINTVDITQGSVQGLCEAINHTITEDGLGVRVNLLFSWENALAKVESALPLEGKLSITVKQPRNLLVRIPTHIEPGSLSITKSGQPVSFEQVGIYALVENHETNTTFEVSFQPTVRQEREFAYHFIYYVRWFGEQVTGIEPVKGLYPLYGDWPGPR